MEGTTKRTKVVFIIIFSILSLELLISIFLLRDLHITTFFIISVILLLIAKKTIDQKRK